MLAKRLLCLLTTTVLLFPLSGFGQNIIVNSKNPHTEISKNMLRAIYSMKLRTWQNGLPITVFILSPDSEAHQKFCLKNLGVFPYQMQRKWDVMVFSGTGQAPIVLADESEMRKKISEIPGAIGYVLNGEVTENVRQVRVH